MPFITVRMERVPVSSGLTVVSPKVFVGTPDLSWFTDEQIIEKQEERVRLIMLKNKAYGMPGTTGTMFSNFMRQFLNGHPIIGIFRAHEKHPFSRHERVIVLICNMCWVFFLTTVFKGSQKLCIEECQGSGCTATVADSMGNEVCDSLCSGGEPPAESQEYACDSVWDTWILTLILSGLSLPYGMLTRAFAECGWVQGCPRCIIWCTEQLGYGALLGVCMLSVCWLILGAMTAVAYNAGPVLTAWLTGVLVSWLEWPAFPLAMFIFRGYKKDKEKWEKEHPGQIALAWPVDLSRDTVMLAKDSLPIVYCPAPGFAPGRPKPAQAEVSDGATPPASPQPSQPLVSVWYSKDQVIPL